MASSAAALAQSVDDTFPAQPFNSLQIQYTIEGVSVGAPVDTPGSTYKRLYKGTTTSNNIRVSGYFIFDGGASGGTTWDCSVRLYTLPDLPELYDATLLSEPFSMKKQTGSYVPFEAWVNIPPDQESVDIQLAISGTYANWQDRDVVIELRLKNYYYGTGSSATSSDTYSGGSSTSDNTGGCCSALVLPLLAAGVAYAGRNYKK